MVRTDVVLSSGTGWHSIWQDTTAMGCEPRRLRETDMVRIRTSLFDPQTAFVRVQVLKNPRHGCKVCKGTRSLGERHPLTGQSGCQCSQASSGRLHRTLFSLSLFLSLSLLLNLKQLEQIRAGTIPKPYVVFFTTYSLNYEQQQRTPGSRTQQRSYEIGSLIPV